MIRAKSVNRGDTACSELVVCVWLMVVRVHQCASGTVITRYA